MKYFDGLVLIRSLILLVLVNLSVPASAACVRLLEGGPWAWWPFNEQSGLQTFDHSGNNNTASVSTNSPIRIPSAKVGGGYAFNGVNQYIEAPDALSLNFGTGNFSIVAWVQPGQQPKSVFTIVDKRRQNPNYRGYSFFLYNGRLGLQLASGAGSSGYANYISAEKMPLNQDWHLVAVSVDRTKPDGIKFYLNGVQLGAAFNPMNQPGSLDSTTSLRIGSVAFAVENLFQGFLDEVMLFPRALSPAEIRSTHSAHSAGLCFQCLTVVTSNKQYHNLVGALKHVVEEFNFHGDGTPLGNKFPAEAVPGNYFLNQNRVTYETVGVSTQNYPFGSILPFLGQKRFSISVQNLNPFTYAVGSDAGPGNEFGRDAIQANFSAPVRAAGFWLGSDDMKTRFIIHRLDSNGNSVNTYPVNQKAPTSEYFSVVSPERCRERIHSLRASPVSGMPFSGLSKHGTYSWILYKFRFGF